MQDRSACTFNGNEHDRCIDAHMAYTRSLLNQPAAVRSYDVMYLTAGAREYGLAMASLLDLAPIEPSRLVSAYPKYLPQLVWPSFWAGELVGWNCCVEQ